MYCYKCGNQIIEESAFCPKCGAKIAIDNTVQQGPTQYNASITPIPSTRVQTPLADANKSEITDKMLGSLNANISRCPKLKEVSITPKGPIAKGKIGNHTISVQYGDVNVNSKLNITFTIVSWVIFVGLWILARAIAEDNYGDEVMFWAIWIPCIILDHGIWQLLLKKETKIVHPFIFETLKPLQSEEGVKIVNTAQATIQPATGVKVIFGIGIALVALGASLFILGLVINGDFEFDFLTGYGLFSVALGAVFLYLGSKTRKNIPNTQGK